MAQGWIIFCLYDGNNKTSKHFILLLGGRGDFCMYMNVTHLFVKCERFRITPSMLYSQNMSERVSVPRSHPLFIENIDVEIKRV